MAWVESQVEIVKSENIANLVIKATSIRLIGYGIRGSRHPVAKVRMVRQHIRSDSLKLCGVSYVFCELDAKLQVTQLAGI